MLNFFLLILSHSSFGAEIMLFVCTSSSNVFGAFFQLTNEDHMSHGMINFDYKVKHSYLAIVMLVAMLFTITMIYILDALSIYVTLLLHRCVVFFF